MPLKNIKTSVAIMLGLLVFFMMADATAQYHGQSYALVIGIDKFSSAKWPKLSYAKKDAEGVADFLRSQGFKVFSLYNERATKTAIIAMLQNILAPLLKENDRVLVFFAGHGFTETLGGEERGYIVPYDGGDYSATYVSMEELRDQSSKMGNAKHQLFIFDSCYGGLFGTRGARPLETNIPNYIGEAAKRPARQFITAGGANQQVLDGGSRGHSFFTQYLLEALRDGLGDVNNDGYITFTELAGYLLPRASNSYQTPASGSLPGHGLGEFIFISPKGIAKSDTAGNKSGSKTAIAKPKSKKWLWIGLGTAAIGGGVAAVLSGSNGGGKPNQKLDDPPGAPTGN